MATMSRSTGTAITDVVKGFDSEEETTNLSSPFVKRLLQNTVRRWKTNHEAAINRRIGKVKSERKKRLRDMTSTFPENRLIPLDVLAREWMGNNSVTVDVRIYLIEKLFPSLIMGLEKLLTEVEKRELVDSTSASRSFNPVNYLAQYLMRNNPIYSNFPEASPYAKGLRKVAEDLKSNIFEMDDNKLAKLKAEAQSKRLEREKMERTKGDEQRRRMAVLEDLFIEWAHDEGTLPLVVIQNGLQLFHEYVKSSPDAIEKGECLEIESPEVDTTGKLLTVQEFKKVLAEYTSSLSGNAFEKLIEYLTKCAYNFQQTAEKETIRYNLKMVFLACDHDGVGVIDRERVLEILGSYYDSSAENTREKLQNPREWPIVDVPECQEDIVKDEEKKQDVKPANADEEISEKEKVDDNVELKKEEIQDKADEDVQDNGNKEGNADKKIKDSKEEIPPEQDELDVKNITSDHSKTADDEEDKSEVSENDDRSPELKQEECEDEVSSRSDSLLSEDRPQSVTTCSAFDENLVNQPQFVYLCEQFLGDGPMRSTLDSLVRFIKASYSETDQQRIERQEKARVHARVNKRKYMVEQLFDFWDVDRAGILNIEEVVDVLSKWKDIAATTHFQNFIEENYENVKEFTCFELHNFIDGMCNACFADEDPFETIVIFLHTSIERTFEERKRGEARKQWLARIETAAKTSGGNLEPVYGATFYALCQDGEAHGHNKIISSSISLLETNTNPERLNRGKNLLRYVAATPDDVPFVVRKCLYPDSRAVSFAAVDSGKPIHIPKVANHPGVHLWNPERKENGTNGSLIVLPLKDHEKRVIGILAVDTLADEQEKSIFITHEISFYQGVAKALGLAMQFVDIRSKTVKIADSAMAWIRRRSQSFKNSNFYLVEPGPHPSDGLALRKMFTIYSDRKREDYENPPRMFRKDNLFKDYLFKCVENSEIITADAYGERHLAFPIRDANGIAIAVVDISIGDVKILPTHEMKEIQKMLQLLALAHREVAGEIAGHQKNIVLEVEKQNEDFRIEIMFDRLMLTDLRENVAMLDARAFAEIKSYIDPPKLVHDILKTVLVIFHTEEEEKFENWSTCKAFINPDLVKMITQYDPTAQSSVDGKKLSETLEGIPMGTVAKQGSLPAQYLFNWAFVCLSLIEHTAKMNMPEVVQGLSATSNSEDTETTSSQNTENTLKGKPNDVSGKTEAET